jgi:hypothetical protein
MPRKKTELAAELATEKESSGADASAKTFVTYAKRVDKYNTRRVKVEVKPSTCDVCGHDMCSANKWPAYEELTPKQQLQAEQLLKAHKERYHTVDELRHAAAVARVLSEETKEQ